MVEEMCSSRVFCTSCHYFLQLMTACLQVERDLLEDGYQGDVIGEVTPDFVLENVVSKIHPS